MEDDLFYLGNLRCLYALNIQNYPYTDRARHRARFYAIHTQSGGSAFIAFTAQCRVPNARYQAGTC
jgi:hypothetical protein